jgi:hypothetical protein
MQQPNDRVTTRSHYVGVFDDRDDAELAARDLRAKGFKDDQIGYAWRDDAGKTHSEGNKSGPYPIPPESLRVFPTDADLPKDELKDEVKAREAPAKIAAMPMRTPRPMGKSAR